MHSQGFSIWLLMPTEIKQQLDLVINSFSSLHGGPCFDPHITLLGSLPKAREIFNETKNLINALPPLQIRCKGLGCLPEWSRCLFIEVELTQELARAHQMAKKQAKDTRGKSYQPHISLLYGHYPMEVKEQLIETLEGWSGKTFVVNSAALVSTEGPPQKWRYLYFGPLRGTPGTERTKQ